MNILVTGASGFMGRSLVPRLEAGGHRVVSFGSRDCDLTKDSSLERFSAQSFDQIFHLASWTQAGDFCLRHPGEQWVINQRINTNVLAWWQGRQPGAKLIYMGTSCSYPSGTGLREEDYLKGEPTESLYTYAMTKRMLHVGVLALRRQYGLSYLCVVPSTLYGPGYHSDGRQMHFVFDLMRKILRGKELGEPVVLWGDGSQRRELVFLPDFLGILCRLALSCDNEVVNVGSGVELTIRACAEEICRIVGYPPERIRYDESRYVGAQEKCLSIAKLRGLLPDLELTGLSDGLEPTLKWFRESGAWRQ